MKELSPAAKALVQSGKGNVDPSLADQERVLAALQGRIAAGEGAAEPAPSSPPAAAPKPWGLVSAGGIGAALVAGALAWNLAPETPPASPPPALSAPLPTSPAGENVPAQAAEPTQGTPAPESVEPVRAEPAHPEPALGQRTRSGALAEEVALLSRATAALHAGRGEEALRAVAEHQQRFPSGRLIEERRSARAQALCLLGRTGEAKGELDQLSPTSPQAARARQRCGL